MKQTAVEFLVKNTPNIYWEDAYWADLFEQAKEMEKQQQGYSEEEVIQFGKFLTEFNNLDNEIECAIKKLFEQFNKQ